jgi:hypothetical protein
LALVDQTKEEHAQSMTTSLWMLPALLVVIAFAAPRYGVDTRDGHDWNRRFGPPEPLPPLASRRRSTPLADLRAVARTLRHASRHSPVRETATSPPPNARGGRHS